MSGWDNLFGNNDEKRKAEPLGGGFTDRPERVEDLPPRPEPQRPDLDSVAEPWFITPDKPIRAGDPKGSVKSVAGIMGSIVAVLIIIGVIVSGVMLAISIYGDRVFPSTPVEENPTTQSLVIENGR